MDLLFSLWDERSTLFVDQRFKEAIQANYLKLLSKKPHAFVGYAMSQTRKYNLKGERYDELCTLITKLETYPDKSAKLDSFREDIAAFLKEKSLHHIAYVYADGPRGATGTDQWEYLEILGKKFVPHVTLAYLVEKLHAMKESYGSRVINTVTDWKALSHAVRVIEEVAQLLEEKFITFPLRQKEYVYAVKRGKIPLEEVMKNLEKKMAVIDTLQESTDLPESQDEDFVTRLILDYYS